MDKKAASKAVLIGVVTLVMGGLGWSIYTGIEETKKVAIKKKVLDKVKSKIIKKLEKK